MKRTIRLGLLWLALWITGCRTEAPPTSDNPSNGVELFGKGVISTGLYERDIAIDPARNEIIYTLGDYKQSRRCLVATKPINGKWTTPQILNISGRYNDIEPFFANSGDRLYFASDRPIAENTERKDYNLWYSDRMGDQWGEPTPLDTLINTEQDEFFPSLSQSGNLYFTAAKSAGIGREDIYVSRNLNGRFQQPEVLDTAINTAFYEFNAYISPDEHLLIFSSYGRPDDLGGGDLYYSKKDESGRWQPAEHMGPIVNSNKLDYCPFIDWNSGYFYFTSEKSQPLPDKISDVDELIDYANQSQNGMGDIYRVKIEELALGSLE